MAMSPHATRRTPRLRTLARAHITAARALPISCPASSATFPPWTPSAPVAMRRPRVTRPMTAAVPPATARGDRANTFTRINRTLADSRKAAKGWRSSGLGTLEPALEAEVVTLSPGLWWGAAASRGGSEAASRSIAMSEPSLSDDPPPSGSPLRRPQPRGRPLRSSARLPAQRQGRRAGPRARPVLRVKDGAPDLLEPARARPSDGRDHRLLPRTRSRSPSPTISSRPASASTSRACLPSRCRGAAPSGSST